jgi:hypothetical protein
MELKRIKQCSHCPWRKDACVDDIPGYSYELHPKLEATIAYPMDWTGLYPSLITLGRGKCEVCFKKGR